MACFLNIISVQGEYIYGTSWQTFDTDHTPYLKYLNVIPDLKKTYFMWFHNITVGPLALIVWLNKDLWEIVN